MRGLRQLAHAHGVMTSYRDNEGRTVRARDAAIEAVLGAMGVDGSSPRSVELALARHREAALTPGMEPIVVTAAGQPGEAAVRVPRGTARLNCGLQRETGETMEWTAYVDHDQPVAGCSARATLQLPPLPPGYHELTIDAGGQAFTALVIAAPPRAAPLPPGQWGLFAPTYALHSQRTPSCGDLADLDAMGGLAGRLGGSLAGTLPLLASFLEPPIDPSPYTPITRSAWNELYAVVAGGGSSGYAAGPFVDYDRVAAERRQALEGAARAARTTPAWQEVLRFAAARPEIDLYARFRGAMVAQGQRWPAWPATMRAGAIMPDQSDTPAYEYHLYAQWLMDGQLRGLGARLRDQGVALYLDLPVGSHPEGFDAWRHQSLYAASCNVGAPPDAFFAGGQDWGFRPLLPEALRRARYAPLIESLRHHMAVAGALRIDHIMGLHRLYWVPHGLGARDGVYVRYPARELYAVLCVESQRHGVPIVGEDLGTVPSAVRREMSRRGLSGMYVAQTELRETGPALRAPPAHSVASLNTHDMPTFAAFWDAATKRSRERLAAVAGCRAGTGPAAMAAALNRWLASTGAAAVLVNPDDLWGELEPQNVPGTSVERPNWRRRLRHSVEELESVASVQALADLTTLRKRGTR